MVFVFGAIIDGEISRGGLLADSKGNLYGATAIDGKFGHGNVFELTGTGFVP